MKTIYKSSILLLAAAAFCLNSCSDSFFDRYPSDSMQMETYGQNDSEVQNILYDAYYYLRLVSDRVIQVNSLATDEAYDNKRNNSLDHINLNESSWDATLGHTSDIWEYCFNMINRCNTVLERLDNVTDENRSQFENEAKFFRAYAYFTLVRLFGPVPITTSVIDNYTSLYSYGRESVESVYELIVQDLQDAQALPEYYTDGSMAGRATGIAASTMLGDVYMNLGDFSSAATELAKVIAFADANPDLLGLEADVYDIYDSENPIGKEIILAAQYNNGATIVSNDLMTRTVPNVVPADQPAYTYPDGTASNILVSVGNSTLLMTWSLWNKLRENPGDKRLTELVYAGIYDSQSVSNQSEEVDVIDVDGATYALWPITLKYFDLQNESIGLSRSSCDNIVYRYAGVLLMYAECMNETGGNAAYYLNLVRSRAGIPDTAASTYEELKLAIEDERLLELSFEGHRWYDLVRTERITPVMEEHFAHRVIGLSPLLQSNENGMAVNDVSDTSGTPASWKWSGSSADVLFAIPYDQIQLTDWEQNEIYR